MAIATEKKAGLGVWLATSGGVGYCPVAPGTAGSLVGIGLMVLIGLLPLSRAQAFIVLATVLILVIAIGVWSAGRAEDYFGRTDPGPVVIDEVAGQLVTFLAWPQASWKWLVAGFFVFRFFDIVKPFPARRLESLPGGWGIMIDDLVSGIYSLVLLYLLHLVLR